jgi:hypothetical protein
MTREEKIQLVRQHASDLQEFCELYSEAASVVEQLPSKVLDVMFRLVLEHGQVHKIFAEALKDA